MACKNETGPILILDGMFGSIHARNDKSSIIMLSSLSEIHSVRRSLENSAVVVEDPNAETGASQRMDVSSMIAVFIDAASAKLHLTCSYFQLLTQLIDLTVLFKMICLTFSQ